MKNDLIGLVILAFIMFGYRLFDAVIDLAVAHLKLRQRKLDQQYPEVEYESESDDIDDYEPKAKKTEFKEDRS